MRRLLLCAGLLCLISAPANAIERITRFHSDIVVQPDRSLAVTETIDVVVENRNIRHGIYRDLPTLYPHPKWAALGLREKTSFDIKSVLVDGRASPWHRVALPNGFRIYIGDKQRLIPPGEHQYVIEYTTTEQLSRVNNADFLNWNVNGQDWLFSTDWLSATVQLPNNDRPVYYDAWLGKSGAIEKAFSVSENTDGSTTFNATRRLDPHEGMTISLELPPGALAPPNKGLGRLIRDNFKWLLGLGLLLLLPLYYLKAWLEFGRDPEKGVVVADYHPVRDMSPAAHHFISQNKSTNKTFAAALLNIAVKGHIRIEQEGKKHYTVHKLRARPDNPRTPLSKGEEIVFSALFKHTDSITLGKTFKPRVATAKERLNKFLKQEWRDAIYQRNSRYSWIGLGIGLMALMLCGLHLANQEIKVGHLLPLLIFMFVAVGLTQHSFKPFLLVSAGFFIFAGLQNAAFSLFNSSIMIWLSLLVAGLFVLFHYLLKAPTPFGQKILDEIEGFRLYLATAEQNRLDILHPPEKTPALFEKLMPYAIALDVENQWNAQFTEVFKQRAEQGDDYSPAWYSGGHYGGFNHANIGAALGAGLASSVAAASTAPSSSSSGGFSGGAGGGGGGGGGGGW